MKDNRSIKVLTGILLISLCAQLTACGKSSDETQSFETIEITDIQTEITTSATSTNDADISTSFESTTNQTTEETTEETTIETTPSVSPTPIPTPTPEPTSVPVTDDDTGLTWQQKNSFSMLYYLAITAENIRISKDNRLVLDEIYTALLNDINPGSIDETTQNHLRSLRDIIRSYMSISTKRERLEYLYNQDKAKAIRIHL